MDPLTANAIDATPYAQAPAQTDIRIWAIHECTCVATIRARVTDAMHEVRHARRHIATVPHALPGVLDGAVRNLAMLERELALRIVQDVRERLA